MTFYRFTKLFYFTGTWYKESLENFLLFKVQVTDNSVDDIILVWVI